MKNKGIGVAVAVLIIVIVAVAGAGAYISMSGSKAPAEFEVSNLRVNPTQPRPGETVTISVDVSNVGKQPGDNTVELKIDGTVENSKTVTLGGGENTTVSFSINEETSKTYSVGIEDLSGSFKVLKPAEFEVSNLNLSSSKVGQGESVDVSVDVNNVGDLSGEYSVELKIDGTTENTKTVTLNGGENTTALFKVKKETKKSYSVEIDNLSDSFEVVAPAQIEVSNLSVNPSAVKPNEEVEVSVDVSNLGGLLGEYEVEMEVNGAVENSKTVRLESSEKKTVSFAVLKEVEKTYSVEIDNLSKEFGVFSQLYEVTNLSVSPESVKTNENVTITANVRNLSSSEEVTAVLELEVDGATYEPKNVPLLPGERKSVQWTFTTEVGGSYIASLEGLSASFNVQKSWEVVEVFGTDYPVSEETTDTFFIQGDKFKLEYAAGGDPDYGLFYVFTYPEGEEYEYVDEIVENNFSGGIVSGSSIVHEGPGYYYCLVGSANLSSWLISVYEWR